MIISASGLINYLSDRVTVVLTCITRSSVDSSVPALFQWFGSALLQQNGSFAAVSRQFKIKTWSLWEHDFCSVGLTAQTARVTAARESLGRVDCVAWCLWGSVAGSWYPGFPWLTCGLNIINNYIKTSWFWRKAALLTKWKCLWWSQRVFSCLVWMTSFVISL